ncbi:UPF0755 protein [Limimonas halophila]|uniref:Endolytic murein transglycosylase n=1 Tax=Limimonas halophila TaxID=1082479 RepID=A0A1G7MGE7_9PROT|nr:endolytic transglycosylase MltG [Limimonas halophila]SDF60280.1 UPF0755 protein [Limimonas halophila]
MRRLLVLLSFFATGIVVAGATGLIWGTKQFESPGPLEARTTVEIPHGAGLSTVARKLKAAGVIEHELVFSLGARLTDRAGALKAGEYAFPPAVSPDKALARIVAGRTVTYSLTIPEGLTSAQVVERVREAEALSGAIREIPAEGTLLPETYTYSRGHTRARMINRMQASMDRLLAKLWPERATDLPIHSKREAVTLASIVEKETAVPDERAVIAGVFINRLRKGMRLQSDPTVRYAVTEGEKTLDRPLTQADLDRDDPYNTYTRKGLPPGPIANPGRAAIKAALNPADTEYLYFVASGNGGHAFAKTLEAHNENVAEYRERQRSN